MMLLVLHYINQLTFSSLPFFFFPLFLVNPCCSLLLSFLPFKNSSIIGNKCACAPPTFYTCIFTWVIKMIHYLFCHGIFIKWGQRFPRNDIEREPFWKIRSLCRWGYVVVFDILLKWMNHGINSLLWFNIN